MGSPINELPNKQQKDDTVMQKARVKLFQPRREILNLFYSAFVIFVVKLPSEVFNFKPGLSLIK